MTDSWCLTNEPIRPTTKTVATMTDEEVLQVLDHNELGAKRCGWKP